MTADIFYKNLPKVELHAHINGSISEKTMDKLISRRADGAHKDWRLMFKKGDKGNLDEAFKIFKLIHQVSDNTDAAYTITYDVIHEFAEDNVKYLELRTTPREVASTGMTKESYIEAVLKAIDDCARENADSIVRLLLAIDRRNSVEVARNTIDLAEKYAKLSNGVVVGIDLSGDPQVGDAREFIPVFKLAQERGLKLALHLAEVPAIEETLEILKLVPGRIGHGTCLDTESGGSKELEDLVLKHKIPLELCLTSNVIGQTVPNYDAHHLQFWYDKSHPVIICTDDKGVFSTSLSEEYSIAADTFNLSRRQLWDLSYNSIDHIFADETVKEKLREKWRSLKETIL